MFKYKNKKEQSDGSEKTQLRQGFRLEIRRRNVESYKQNIRNIYLSPKQNYQSLQQFRDPEVQNNLQNEGEDSTQNQNQLLYYLQQLSLTHPSSLCQVQILIRISEVLEFPVNVKTYGKIDSILIKMCVNQYYWSDEFLSQLMCLLQLFSGKGLNIYQYLIHIGETQIISQKLRAYTLIIQKKLLLSLIRHQPDQIWGKKKFDPIEVVEVLKCFLAQAPVVSHKERYLGQISPYNCFLHIIQVLLLVLKTQRDREKKDIYEITQIIHIVVSKLEQEQIRPVLNVMKDQKWQLLMQLIKQINDKKIENGIDIELYNKFKCQKKSEHHLDIRLKFKMLQITVVIIQFLLFQHNSSRTILELIYAFLPQLCVFLVSDTQFFFGAARPNALSTIELKYESALLKEVIILLSVKDQLQQIPALQYLMTKHPSFFKNLYCGFNQVKLQKESIRRHLVQILKLMSEKINNMCCQLWVVEFVIDFLDSSNYQWSITFKNILKEHKHKEESCLLEKALMDNRIVRKIQQMIENLSEEGELKNKLEALLNLIQSNIKD